MRLAVTIAALALSLLAAAPADAYCTLNLRYQNGSLAWDRVDGATEYWVFEAYGDPLVYRQHTVRATTMAVARRSSVASIVRYTVIAIVPIGIRSFVEEEPPLTGDGTDACAASISVTIPPDAAFRALTRRAILPVVGSTPGSFGGKFKTSLIMRPIAASQRGRLIFHPAGKVAADTDPSIPYAFEGGQPLVFDDVVAAMGQSGIGSLDIVPDEDASPIVPAIEARLYNDTSIGTFGTLAAPMYPYDYLRPPPLEVVIPENDRSRINIGFRTLTEAKMRILIVGADGRLLSFHDVTYPSGWMQMTSASDFVGKTLTKGQVVQVQFNGSVIPFYTVTENSTNDPTLIVVSPRTSTKNVGAYVD